MVRDGKHTGLLVERPEGTLTAESFKALTGSDAEYDAWRAFYGEVTDFAEAIAPTLLSPLRTEKEIREQVEAETWDALVAHPLGKVIEERFADDTVRGVVATDALIGTFAGMNDPSLVQNRCFLYHVIGNGTGEWRVPVGGMGAVTDALAEAARLAGVEIVTGAGVSRIESDGTTADVMWHDGRLTHNVEARWVLSNVAPWVLQILLGEEPGEPPMGSQLKINFLLDRLPRLRSGVDPEVAFAGTFHVAEDYTQLQAAYDEAAAGKIPSVPPGELYCHSLTDPSILGSLAGTGKHTLTYFGVHMPPPVFGDNVAANRDHAVERPGRDQRAPRGADRGLPGGGRERQPVPGGEDPAGRGQGARDAGRPHLPRRPVLAVGPEPLAPGHPRAALGRLDRHPQRAAVRLRRPTGRGGQRYRWAQRRAGGAGGPPGRLTAPPPGRWSRAVRPPPAPPA